MDVRMNSTEERRQPLTDRQIEMMLMVLMRKETAFLLASAKLEPSDFAEQHRSYAVIWAVVCDHYAEFDSLPDEENIIAEIESRLDSDPDAMSLEESNMLDSYLRRVFRRKEDRLDERLAFSLLKRYLEDRLSDKVRATLSNSSHTPANMFGLMSGFADEASTIGAIEPDSISKPFEKGWNALSSLLVDKIPTGVTDIDNFTHGGVARGEAFGILGPHGSCKTTLAMQICCDWAKYYRDIWRANGCVGSPEMVYMFVYEGSMAEMRLRALSHTGQVARESLELGDPNALSSPNNLRDYERHKFRLMLSNNRPVPCERQRYRVAQHVLNDNLRIIDMTGNDPDHPGRGWGLVPEIASILQGEVDLHRLRGEELKVGGIMVDYVGAAVERYIDMAPKASHDNLRHLISKFPMHAKNKLALHFNCPVGLLHQLSGEANSFAPGKPPKGTDSSECKSFRENLDFLFVVGNPNSESYAVMTLDKHRRGAAMKEVIIFIDGRFCTVLSTDRAQVLHHGQIIEASSLRQIAIGPSTEDDNDPYTTVPGEDADEQTAAVRHSVRRGTGGSSGDA